ncbi:helix-turn-helix domain-containing protein [Spirosoma endbachense]|uniref:Helix-turn-helix domain-containing protein n=1 Tax=Spirosoma endbachense TaxID=2666025 RepID=A0A6P1W927_9BACT|nr:helix-turn-helix domain-containing protein [Spirosoma endbachense]QHW00548.1 helix-turn-helix domain-containing protein [Spirosoma endbachense]
MKNQPVPPHIIPSISAIHKWLGLPKPAHPLVSVIDLKTISIQVDILEQAFAYSFYSINLKKNFDWKVKYGQQHYDFDEGVMTFQAPGQVLKVDADGSTQVEGYSLFIHPDFFNGYLLAAKIRQYNFFSYAVHEALHLSDTEEQLIMGIMENLSREINSSIDTFSQDLIISHIDLLLNYANRFYHRQFITRKPASFDVLTKFETLLDEHFSEDHLAESGSPSVQLLADQLNFSSKYLSDLLKTQTGMNAKQHIQNRLIEKTKEILTTTSLSVGEIAFMLGFEYPQSLNKLFKNKTNVSPLEYRASFN